jgi:threonyl-tRNA synthetase
VRLSTRNPQTPEKYLGSAERWDAAEALLKSVATKKGAETLPGEGEAAFYGPKLDFMGTDAIGRQHQVATIQLDFNQPERFDLSCVNEKGEDERIVMIHAAIMGSIERFMALLIEHTAGNFPLWLSPVQARIIAVSEKFQSYGEEVFGALKEAGVRVELADCNETLGKRIRAAQVDKVPYVLVVGEEEVNTKTVATKLRGEDLGKLSLEALSKKIQKEIQEKTA